ncbi:MAG: hypothetical protein ACK5X3_05630 [Pseudomonadota bacterium]
MPTEYRTIGSVRVNPISVLADRAAERIANTQHRRVMAVTCTPEGMVSLEPFDDAVPDDVVGVYDAAKLGGTLTTARRIAEDLRHHRELQRVEA